MLHLVGFFLLIHTMMHGSMHIKNYQTTLPPKPDEVTLREARIYCVGKLNCVPYRVLG
jgi:hypothetical protein